MGLFFIEGLRIVLAFSAMVGFFIKMIRLRHFNRWLCMLYLFATLYFSTKFSLLSFTVFILLMHMHINNRLKLHEYKRGSVIRKLVCYIASYEGQSKFVNGMQKSRYKNI